MIYFCQFNVRIMYGKITSTLPVNKLYVPALVAEMGWNYFWNSIIIFMTFILRFHEIVVKHKLIANEIKESSKLSNHTKGQLISKCLFGIFNSPKKQTKKFNFTTMVPQVELFSFFFWENWRHKKDISKLTDL